MVRWAHMLSAFVALAARAGAQNPVPAQPPLSAEDKLRLLKANGALIDNLVRDGVVSHSAAKQIFAVMVRTGDPPAQIAEREGLVKVSDDASLVAWIDAALAEHPAEAARFLGGERRLQGVLVGYVMKKSNGSADPKRVNQLLGARVAT